MVSYVSKVFTNIILKRTEEKVNVTLRLDLATDYIRLEGFDAHIRLD